MKTRTLSLILIFLSYWSYPLLGQIIQFEPDYHGVFVSSFTNGLANGDAKFEDLDGDGDLDLVICGTNIWARSNTQWLINDGTGQFADKFNSPFPDISGKFLLEDFTGDGKVDAIFAGFDGMYDIVEYFINDGNYHFIQDTSNIFEKTSYNTLDAADVDGDGDKDLLITGFNSNVPVAVLYKNDGTGHFTEVSGTPFVGMYMAGVAFSDVDGDQDEDILMCGDIANARRSFLYINDGLGGYTLKPGTPFEQVWNSDLAFGDTDGDSLPEVMIMGSQPYDSSICKMYSNQGNGEFDTVISPQIGGMYAGEISFVDIDTDGDNDLLISGLQDLKRYTSFFCNDGQGNFTEIGQVGVEPLAASCHAFGDVDGDGDLDLLMLGSNSDINPDIRYYRNTTIPRQVVYTEDEQVSLFPNPTDGWVNLYIQEKTSASFQIKVYSGLGILKKSLESQGLNPIRFFLEGRTGIYFMDIWSGNNHWTKKVIKY